MIKIIEKEIFHDGKLNLNGKKITREAVRGIIIVKSKLLLLHSPQKGDFKFPGGGIKEKETHSEALSREIMEECGCQIGEMENLWGKIYEYKRPIEEDYDVFKLTSLYYFCKAGPVFKEQKLDGYEKKLELTPVWIDIDRAIEENKRVLKGHDVSRWVWRETYVLEKLREKHINNVLY